MSSRRRTPAVPVVLAVAAAMLMLLPRGLPGSVRTTLALALVPFRSTALGAERLVGGAGAPADELQKLLDFERDRALQYQNKLSQAIARIEQLTGLREVLVDPQLRLLSASVIVSADSSAWRRSIMIARGSSEGVRLGQIVLWERHLVGRIVEVGPWSSRVQLASDPAFKAGAVAAPRPAENGGAIATRETGVFEGSGDRHGVLKWIAGDARVEPGTLVVTTVDPANGVPAGLILGRAGEPSRGRADVQPFVNARALESVTVILGEDR